MKTTNKRLVGILLCLAMVLAMMPMAVFAADTVTVYFANTGNWSTVSVYWWGSAGNNPGWPGETATDLGNGYWSYDIPADLAGKEGLIFNNGGNGAQTANLTLPTTGENCYNYTDTAWSVYSGAEVEIPETVYYLRGTMNGWGVDDPMTDNGDGTYSITMELAAGTYEYKAAVADWSWSCPGGSNLSLTLDADDTVTFTLDLAANSLTYTLGSGVVVETEYFLRGTMNDWGSSDKFEKQADGTYAITLSLAAGTYEYKAAVADWSWSVPGGDNAVLTLTEAADVTFVLNVEEGTLTNDAPVVEEPPVEYDYYVAGDEKLCDVAWDPCFVDNKMVYNEETGLYEIVFDVWYEGTYEYKITTGTWEPSYGYGEGNYSVVVKNPGEVTITFNAETTEVTCDVYEFGEAELKFQLNADASADDATVDLRLITSVETLDYANVEFRVTINDETAFLNCEVVYEAIKANGVTLTCDDIFGYEGYLVTYTITDIPAEYYGADIQVCAVFVGLDGYEIGTNYRTVVLSDLLG